MREEEEYVPRSRRRGQGPIGNWVILGLLTACVVLLSLILMRVSGAAYHEDSAPIETQYTAVLLSNNLAYFGRVQRTGPRYLEMTDVYYVQSGMDAKTNKPKNVLVKRGNEWHSPNRMVINTEHIVFQEPVSPSSALAELIRKSKTE